MNELIRMLGCMGRNENLTEAIASYRRRNAVHAAREDHAALLAELEQVRRELATKAVRIARAA